MNFLVYPSHSKTLHCLILSSQELALDYYLQAAFSIASINSADLNGLFRNASTGITICDSSSLTLYAVIRITFTSGCKFLIRFTSSIPDIEGIRTSDKTSLQSVQPSSWTCKRASLGLVNP